jgi:probable selenium-dependent hydroxylase accessory protein YqeC
MVESRPLDSLAKDIGLGSHEHIALVGGGGKTTLLHALADQLVGSVVLTSTTKMGSDQHRGRPVLVAPTTSEIMAAVARSPVVVWKSIYGEKALGVSTESCDEWFGVVDHMIVEADGSRRRPFKAPAGHEPVVGDTTTTMISVIGADALGRVIGDQCHRPLRVAALAGCTPYERLSPASAASVLLHERGARKEMPLRARLVIAVTKVDAVNIPFVDELVGELNDRSPTTAVAVLEFE